ncbi:dethiobiotin synthase [Hydrogenimonas sp.]
MTGTNTGVGKTHTTLLLMEESAKRGFRPAAIKPMETGVTEGNPADGTALLRAMHRLNPQTHTLTIDDVVPYRFELPAAPYVAKGDTIISYDHLEKCIERVGSICDILFIEGAGGPMVPIDENTFMIDLPIRFRAHTLLISPSRLGSINDTLLSMEALKRRNISFDLIVNLYEEAETFREITLPYYEKAGILHTIVPLHIERFFTHSLIPRLLHHS